MCDCSSCAQEREGEGRGKAGGVEEGEEKEAGGKETKLEREREGGGAKGKREKVSSVYISALGSSSVYLQCHNKIKSFFSDCTLILLN